MIRDKLLRFIDSAAFANGNSDALLTEGKIGPGVDMDLMITLESGTLTAGTFQLESSNDGFSTSKEHFILDVADAEDSVILFQVPVPHTVGKELRLIQAGITGSSPVGSAELVMRA